MRMGGLEIQGLQSSLFFETPEEIYARVFRELKPRTAPPAMRVEFCRFANADSFIRLEQGRLHGADFGPAGGRAGAGDRGAGVYSARQAVPQGRCRGSTRIATGCT